MPIPPWLEATLSLPLPCADALDPLLRPFPGLHLENETVLKPDLEDRVPDTAPFWAPTCCA